MIPTAAAQGPIVADSPMITADMGISASAMAMELTGASFLTSCVTGTTQRTTTSGFTLAYHSGIAWSPTVRRTYLGIDAYICPWMSQNPAVMRISARNRPLRRTVASPANDSRTLRGAAGFAGGRYISTPIASAIAAAPAEYSGTVPTPSAWRTGPATLFPLNEPTFTSM